MWRSLLCTGAAAILLNLPMSSGTPSKPIRLWPQEAPGPKSAGGLERDSTTEKDRMVGGRRVIRLTDISVPEMTIYPADGNKTDAAVLVFPGGGYRVLAWDLEGTEVCEWFNSIGVTCGLIKYRVPAPEGTPRWAPALQDAQRAIGLMRTRARELGIDPAKVGVLGFSAGAHLSAALSTNYEKRSYDRVDAADDRSAKPAFAVLIYPGGIVPRDSTTLAPELKVNASVPPTFIAQTADDNVRVENSLVYYAALKEAKVPVEMHLYPTGGHGYGLRKSADTVTTWPARVEDWLRALHIIGK